jgi:hypothetical protein
MVSDIYRVSYIKMEHMQPLKKRKSQPWWLMPHYSGGDDGMAI